MHTRRQTRANSCVKFNLCASIRCAIASHSRRLIVYSQRTTFAWSLDDLLRVNGTMQSTATPLQDASVTVDSDRDARQNEINDTKTLRDALFSRRVGALK